MLRSHDMLSKNGLGREEMKTGEDMVVVGRGGLEGSDDLKGLGLACRAGHSAFSSSQGTNQQQHHSTFGHISAIDSWN